jgi:hypothetical protein
VPPNTSARNVNVPEGAASPRLRRSRRILPGTMKSSPIEPEASNRLKQRDCILLDRISSTAMIPLNRQNWRGKRITNRARHFVGR